MPEDATAALAALRQRSRRDYLHALLLPEGLRTDFVALRRYHHQMRAVVEGAREPALAQIQLQWWAEGVQGARAGEIASHPVGAAVLAYMQRHPAARPVLHAKALAHEAELFADGFEDRTQFEGCAGETRSVLVQLLVDDGAATEASGHYGVCETVVETLLALPAARQRGVVAVPLDILSQADAVADDWLSGAETRDEVVQAFAAYGLDHARRARAALEAVPPAALRCYAPLRLFEWVLHRARREPATVWNGGAEPEPLREQWLLWRR